MSEPWTVEHDSQTAVITVTFTEPFRLTDVDIVSQMLEADGHLKQSRILNFTQCEGLTPTTTELLDIAKRSADWQMHDGVKVAWLASSQVDAGLLRIVTSKFNDRVMKVFVSETEAKRWLSTTKSQAPDSPGLVEHEPVRLRGELSLDEVLRTQQTVRASEEYKPERSLLWDLRECRLTESLAEVKDLAVFIAGNHNRDRSGYKSAVLVDSHLMDLLIREMAKVSEWPAADVVVFRSYRDAVAWLSSSSVEQ